MTMRVMLIAVAFAVTACSRPGPATETERRAAIAGISVVLDSMNAAWRRADFAASDRPLLDEGLVTFNDYRSPVAAARARTMENPTGDFAGQYIGDYTARYDVLSRDVAVTTWENDFARIALDSTGSPCKWH